MREQKEKKPISIIKVEFFNSLIFGLIFIISGIMETIKMSVFIEITLLVLMVVGILFSVLKGKGEDDDEMSKINKMKANNDIMFIMQIVVGLIFVYAIQKHTLVIDLRKVIPFCIGSIKLAYFGLFVFYEKVGA